MDLAPVAAGEAIDDQVAIVAEGDAERGIPDPAMYGTLARPAVFGAVGALGIDGACDVLGIEELPARDEVALRGR